MIPISYKIPSHRTHLNYPLPLFPSLNYFPPSDRILIIMSPSKKPTIVLIPGAWHLPAHYRSLLQTLEAQGYPTVCKKIPSVLSPDLDVPEDVTSHTLTTDAAYARKEILLPALEDNDVILVMHSYGGAVGGAAAQGLGRGEQVREGGHSVLGLVYLCAIVGSEGKPILGRKEDLAPWASLDEETSRMTVPDPSSTFYELVPDGDESKTFALANLQHHSISVFLSPSPPQAYNDSAFEGRCAYVRCHIDQAIPLFLQDIFQASAESVNWNVEDLESAGHSPFMTHRDQTLAIIEKYAKQWA